MWLLAGYARPDSEAIAATPGILFLKKLTSAFLSQMQCIALGEGREWGGACVGGVVIAAPHDVPSPVLPASFGHPRAGVEIGSQGAGVGHCCGERAIVDADSRREAS